MAKSQRRRGAVSGRVLELMGAKKSPPKKTHTWEITLIRRRGKFLGYVSRRLPSVRRALSGITPFRPELLHHAWQPTRTELLWRKWRRWLAIAVIVIIAVVVGISRKVIGLLRPRRR